MASAPTSQVMGPWVRNCRGGPGMGWRVGMGMAASPQRGARMAIAVPGDTPSGSLLDKLLFSGRRDMQISLLWASRQHLWSHMRN